MPKYKMICASVQGARHIRHGQPCEDCGKVYESESCSIFAVADGHGDPNCPRSRFGSEAACDTAVNELKDFSGAISENCWDERLTGGGKELEGMVRHLVSSIMAKWIQTVNEDLEASPLTEEERAACDTWLERYDRGENLEHIYGTTLIAGLRTEKYLLLLQQGDGRCDVFDAAGDVTQPIPWDERCFANVTTSLCEEDAVQSFRYCVIDMEKNPPAACLAGSDGVEDSFFSMDLMHSYYRDLLIYAAENGMEALRQHLADTLPDFTARGSGDDVTICGFIDTERIQELIPAFRKANERISLESVIRQTEDRLKSMNGMGKMDALKTRREKAAEKAALAEAELQRARKALEKYEADMKQVTEDPQTDALTPGALRRVLAVLLAGDPKEMMERKAAEFQKSVETARFQMEEARAELAQAEEEYLAFTSKKENFEKEIAKARQSLFEMENPDNTCPEEPEETNGEPFGTDAVKDAQETAASSPESGEEEADPEDAPDEEPSGMEEAGDVQEIAAPSPKAGEEGTADPEDAPEEQHGSKSDCNEMQ